MDFYHENWLIHSVDQRLGFTWVLPVCAYVRAKKLFKQSYTQTKRITPMKKLLSLVVLLIGMISTQLGYGQSVTITTTPNPANICAGQSITLQANPIGGIASTYLWTPGGATSQSIVESPSTTTIYMVRVIFTNNDTAIAYQTVTVAPNPTPGIVTIPAVPIVCEGETVQLYSSPADTYQWYLNGTAISGANAPTYIAYVAGSYGVYATTGICSQMSANTLVTINPLPLDAESILGTSIICQMNTASYLTNSIVYAEEYIWSVPTGAAITSGQGTQMIQVSFAEPGSGYISVRGHNICGDGQASLLPIVVNPSPLLNISATSTTLCAGASTDITANSNGGSFVWTPGGSTSQTIHVSPLQTTTYFVVATLGSCTSTDNITIDVHPLPAVSLALSPISACTSENMITLTGGSPSGPGGSYIGACVFGSDIVYPSISPVGTYPITYTFRDDWGCTATSQAANFTINPVPAVMFTNITASIYVDTPPFDLTPFVSPTEGVFSGPGIIGNYFNPFIAGSGTHMITYTYTHPITGCFATQIQYISVGPLGVDDISTTVNNITIFPNPADSQLNMSGIDTKIIKSIRIMNVLGKIVYTTKTVTDTMQLNVSDYASSMYIVSFITAEGVSTGKYFMKKWYNYIVPWSGGFLSPLFFIVKNTHKKGDGRIKKNIAYVGVSLKFFQIKYFVSEDRTDISSKIFIFLQYTASILSTTLHSGGFC